jgi:DivIVA domain-containing protein
MPERHARPSAEPAAPSARGPLSSDDIVRRTFPSARKGLDESAVRAFLRTIATELDAARRREDDLRVRLAATEATGPAPGALTPEMLLQALGEETARVLRSAQEAAEDIRRRAEEHAASLVQDAHDDARRVRDETASLVDERAAEAQAAADAILEAAATQARQLRADAEAYAATTRDEADQAAAARTAEADGAAAAVRAEADQHARQVRADADTYAAATRKDADETAAERLADATRRATAEIESARTRGRQMVSEAQTVRERMLADLARRRAAAQARVDELRVGRDRLLEAYTVVRRTLEEATIALARAEDPTPEHRVPVVASMRTAEGTEDEERAPTVVGGIVFDVEVNGAPAAIPEIPAMAATADDDGDLERYREHGGGGDGTGDGVAPVIDLRAASEPLTDAPAADDGEEGAGRDEPEPAPAAGEADHDDAATHGATHAATHDDTSGDRGGDRDGDGDGGEPDAVPDRGAVLESADPIDALFERLRTTRRGTPADAPDAPGTNGHGAPVTVIDRPGTGAEPAAPAPSPAPAPAPADAAVFARRDAETAPVVTALGRKVKRLLQDEQNELLSRLRRTKRGVDVGMLPSHDGRVAALVEAALPLLRDAHTAGTGPTGAVATDGADAVAAVADSLAHALLAPLRERLVDSLSPSGMPSTDAKDAAERVSAQYREWKTQRVEPAVRDAVHAAWVRGAYDAVGAGRTLRWLVDPAATCPDCDDNGLEPTPHGEAFPTGHLCPPAHPGCRCVLAPA